MDRRSFVIGSAASAAALAAPPALAQEGYPAHAITVISPFPPGGVSDTITRPLDAALEKVFKQPVVLENKVGAAGAVGAQFAAAAKPDGYTLLSHIVSISGFAAVDKLFGRTPKFTNDNFIPIARIIADPIVMIANVDTPYKTLKDLVADAKANPNKVIYSSSGLYGASHIPTALFAKSAGNLQMRHLPTNGGGPAVTAVLGGNVNFFMSPTSIALSHIRSGKVRALAVSSAQRVKVLPDVPTALFAKSAGNLQMRHLPTNGGGPAVTAVLGGNVNFFMSPTSIALSHIRSGKVRALAVSSAQRVKVLPDVPTFKELGYDLEYYFWVGIFAPKGVPAPIIVTLRDGFNKAAHSKEFLDTLANLGQELAYMDQPEFAKFWEADAKRQEDAINSIGRVQG